LSSVGDKQRKCIFRTTKSFVEGKHQWKTNKEAVKEEKRKSQAKKSTAAVLKVRVTSDNCTETSQNMTFPRVVSYSVYTNCLFVEIRDYPVLAIHSYPCTYYIKRLKGATVFIFIRW